MTLDDLSSPTRGTWIERSLSLPRRHLTLVVPHAGDVDRKIAVDVLSAVPAVSSPTRGTWIERLSASSGASCTAVVPHAGDVDRKSSSTQSLLMARVVPHAGDVDRKEPITTKEALDAAVVPHAGDVDRKFAGLRRRWPAAVSSPTRGTWIER